MNKQFFSHNVFILNQIPCLKTLILIILKVIFITHNSFAKCLKFGKYTVINRFLKTIFRNGNHCPAYPNSPDRTFYHLIVTC